MPTANAALRRSLDEWFEKEKLHPKVVGEFEDSALMKVFGQATGWLYKWDRGGFDKSQVDLQYVGGLSYSFGR